MTRIVFMGTPEFAVPALKKLAQTYELVGVFTQPDRAQGRGRKMQPPVVKSAALALDLPVFQPKSLGEAEAQNTLIDLKPDLIVVAAYGQILRKRVLNLPQFGCLNIHASLLPRWRGAAPVAYAIKAGDSETGVSIMKMNRGLDSGPVLSKKAIAIRPEHTRGSLTEELAELGADLLLETLPGWLSGQVEAIPQDNDQVSLAPKIQKAAGLLNWEASALEIDRHIRAFSPWPGTFTHWQGKLLKVLSAQALPNWQGKAKAGEVLSLAEGVAIATGEGALLLDKLQLAGKKAALAQDFVRGAQDFLGSQL